MPSVVTNRQEVVSIATELVALLERGVEHVIRAESQEPELVISLAIVDAKECHAMNRDYLAHDYPTDVITFPLREEGDPDPLLGEVIVSAERAREEAIERGLPFEQELLRYAVHGALHLLGFDDQSDEDREAMHARQELLIAEILGS